MGLINKAMRFATERHKNQTRKFSHKLYITHPREVAMILLSVLDDADQELIAAAVLHDVVEDTYTNQGEGFTTIRSLFGDKVSGLVRELTTDKIDKDLVGKKQYLTDKMNNMSSDALLIKLADRYHNVESLLDEETDVDFIKWYWKETVYIIDNLRTDLTGEHELLLGNINELLEHIKIKVIDRR